MSTSMAERRRYIATIHLKGLVPHAPFKGCCSTSSFLAQMPQELSAQFSKETPSKVLPTQGTCMGRYPSFMPLLEHYKLPYSSFEPSYLITQKCRSSSSLFFQSPSPPKSKAYEQYDFQGTFIINQNISYSDRKECHLLFFFAKWILETIKRKA